MLEKIKQILNTFCKKEIDEDLLEKYIENNDNEYYIDEIEDFIDTNLKKEYNWLYGGFVRNIIDNILIDSKFNE